MIPASSTASLSAKLLVPGRQIFGLTVGCLLTDPTAPVAESAQEGQGSAQTPVSNPQGDEGSPSKATSGLQEAAGQGLPQPALTADLKADTDETNPAMSTVSSLPAGERGAWCSLFAFFCCMLECCQLLMLRVTSLYWPCHCQLQIMSLPLACADCILSC